MTLEKYINQLRMRRLSEKTIELYSLELRTLLKLLHDRKLIEEHLKRCAPVTHARKLQIWKPYLQSIGNKMLNDFRMPKVIEKQISFLNEDEILKFKNEMNQLDDESKLFFELALGTGMRISEIMQAKHSQLEGAWLKVIRKGGRAQRIPLSENLRAKIEKFKGFVRSKNFYQKLVHQITKRSGIAKKVTVHTLRHTFATKAIRSGYDIVTVRDMLGHRNLAVTNRYCHSTSDQLLKLVEGIQ